VLLAHTASVGVILFGGQSATNAPLGDTWLWSSGAWADLSASLATAPPAGPCIGASGDVGVHPYLVSGSGLWRWSGAWNLLDNNVPTLVGPVLGVLASGNPLLVGSSAPEVQTHEFAAGSWVRRGNAPTNLGSIERDPRRGCLIGSSGIETYVYSD